MAFVNCFASANAPKYVGMTGMGEIVLFRQAERRPPASGRTDGCAEILFFTGVRYEREFVPVTQPPAPPKRRRTASAPRPRPRKAP